MSDFLKLLKDNRRSSPGKSNLPLYFPQAPTQAEFDGPTLNPVPTPETPEVPFELLAARLHLEKTDPIDDFAGLAMHVAMLTLTVAELLARIEELENGP